MKRHLLVVGVAAVIAAAATMAAAPVLAGAPSLPATARKLSGAEIAALYDGATFKFTDFLSEVPRTGTVTFDFKKLISSGDAKTSGHFLSAIRPDGDQLCGQGGGYESCRSVYIDNKDIYEVDSKGVVVSTLQKQ